MLTSGETFLLLWAATATVAALHYRGIFVRVRRDAIGMSYFIHELLEDRVLYEVISGDHRKSGRHKPD